jgi:hypothetical protein
LQGIQELDISGCSLITDGAFANFAGIKTLNMGLYRMDTFHGDFYHDPIMITDAALVYLKGIQELNMSGVNGPITIAGFTHLIGIQRLSLSSSQFNYIATARALGLPLDIHRFDQ